VNDLENQRVRQLESKIRTLERLLLTHNKLKVDFSSIDLTSFNDDDGWEASIDENASDISDMANDGVVSPQEKPNLRQRWYAIVDEKSDLDSEADNAGASRIAYDNAYGALDTYLNTTLEIFTELNMTMPTDVEPTIWDGKWNTYFTEKIKLINSMSYENTGRIGTNESNITINADNINLRVQKNDVINQINISTEGVTIDGDNIQINGDTYFADYYNPAKDGTMSIRSATAPTVRPGSSAPLKEGDMWIDTDDGDAPYTWNGSSWVTAYTHIAGGSITTGTINANRIIISSSQVTDVSSGADQTSTHTANNASNYTGNAISTSYTNAKCTDANADQTSANAQSYGWLTGTKPPHLQRIDRSQP